MLIRGVFEPRRFLDLLRYFVVFEDDGDRVIKKIAGYPPDKQEAATTLVLRQAELLSAQWVGAE